MSDLRQIAEVAPIGPSRRSPARVAWAAVLRHPRLTSACALSALTAAALVSAAAADGDSGTDLVGAIASTARTAARLRWQFGALVVVLAAAHYFAAAVAARAAVDAPLTFGETFLVQLAASAANRLTPAGLGGSALIARYYVRRAGVGVAGAAGAVMILTVLGGLADVAVLTGLLTVGRWAGLGGGTRELVLLVRRVEGALGPVRSPWLWAVVAALAATAAGLWFSRNRARMSGWLTGFARPALQLARRPRSLLTLLTASGSTTLILAFAFVACTAMVPGQRPAASLGALVVAFMVGSAAGNAVPVPAGLGATEAALSAVLVGGGVSGGHAIEIVLLFRMITFWAPAAVGVFAAAALRRRAAI